MQELRNCFVKTVINNRKNAPISHRAMIVPMLRVGMPPVTLRVTLPKA